MNSWELIKRRSSEAITRQMTSNELVCCGTFAFFLATITTMRYFRLRGPYVHMRTVATVYHRVLTILSFAYFFMLIWVDFFQSGHKDSIHRFLRLVFHGSKFVEYADVLLALSYGGGSSVDLYSFILHITSPIYTHIRIVKQPELWQPFTSINSLYQAALHARDGGIGFLSPNAIVLFRGIQLLVGLNTELFMIYARHQGICDGDGLWANFAAIVLLSLWLKMYEQDEFKPYMAQQRQIQEARERQAGRERQD